MKVTKGKLTTDRDQMKGMKPPGTFDPIGFCQIYIKKVKNFYLPEIGQK